MIPRLWRLSPRLRQWWRDNRSLAETRDRAVRAEWECTRLRQQWETAVDDAARNRLQAVSLTAECATLRLLVADLEATLEALGLDQIPEVPG